MRKPLMVALAVAVLLVGVGAGTVGAQDEPGPGVDPNPIRPVPFVPGICMDPQFDLNGDGRVDKRDVTWWDEHAAPCLDPFGNPIPGAECDPKCDVNRDGVVDLNDLAYLYRHVFTCLFRPTDVQP